jgi:hypothetical protein
MLIADGLDEAIIGTSTKDLAVYDVYKIIAILVARDGMTEEEALEFFEFNIDGSYMGEQTPIFVYLDEGDNDA